MSGTRATRHLRIGIVGGSIAGCIAAIMLGRAGHAVTVFERSRSGLIGRGGGVSTSRRVLDDLRAADILDADFPASPFDTLKMSKAASADAYLGHCPLTRPLDMECVHWSGLWENLRKRVPDGAYHRGRRVTGVREDASGAVTLTFAEGAAETVDLVLFADGYNSLGRKILFPDIDITYRGYTVWRGVLPEAAMDDLAPLADHPRYSFRDMPGSFVSFVVPSRAGSTVPGERLINWAAYIPLAQDELAGFMVDIDGQARSGTIPAHAMRPEQDEGLKALMRRQLPRYYSGILDRSEGNQIQLIYTCAVPAYARGRMGLIGDAGVIVQPLTGAGVFKGYSNVRDLLGALDRHGDLDAALADWSAAQVRVADRMLAFGQELEDAFIWNTIDLATASADECDRWWDRSIHIPAEFSYFAEGMAVS